MTKYLYRKTMLAVTLFGALLALCFPLQAQLRVPPPERKTPRAVGVVETYKNGSKRLVPITFYYEKRYYDATFYHATPVPFTLYSETVYEVQQFGKPLGTFTVQSATRNQAAWFGNGKFKGIQDTLLTAKKKVKPIVTEDPSKPTLHRREGSEGDNPTAHPSASASAPEADDDPDRPKLHRRDGGGDASTTAAPQNTAGGAQTGQTQGSTPNTTSGGNPSTASNSTPSTNPGTNQASTSSQTGQTDESSGQDPDRPKLQHKDSGKGGAESTETPTPTTAPASTTAPGSTTTVASTKGMPAPAEVAERTPSDDPDHPILRRGKPVEAQGGRDLPDFKLEEAVSRQVAVSDAGPVGDPQQLIYVCREEERKQLESNAREMAESELRRMAAQRGLVLPAAKSAAGKAASTKAASKTATQAAAKKSDAAELKPSEEQFVPYDLEYNNYATVVYSARFTPTVPVAAASSGAPAAGAPAKSKSWVVTVIAREDENFKLVKLFSAVSDPRELDLYPEVRLVDAVDPDGYGHYALLFREKKRDGVSWLLGRATGYELQTIFETPSR